MPIISTSDILKMFEVMRKAVEMAEQVRNSNPARKGDKGKDVCRFCDEEIREENGEPVIIHAPDCPWNKAQNIR